jgi:DNA mismatch repair ATPase MutL
MVLIGCSSKNYGFRGEALSSICSVANVSIVSKAVNEPQAKRYVLNHRCEVVTESPIAYGKGTVITVEKIFCNIPVRRQMVQDKNRCASELREIEGYLKSIAVVNPSIHMSLYHNNSLVWTKASVPTIEQALITVLGHTLAKNLVKFGPVNIEVQEDEKRKRTIEAYLPRMPINVKTMSYTTNKLSMVFVNRKRVNLKEFEKVRTIPDQRLLDITELLALSPSFVIYYEFSQLVSSYVDGAAQHALSDSKRFPVFVVNIRLPSNEVDFNLDVDKSKIMMVHKVVLFTANETYHLHK